VKLWSHTRDEQLAQPIDALAMLVLEAFGPTGWNVDSFFKEAAQSHPVFKQLGVAERISDAWS
jgi:hypothetical protein